MAKRTYETDAIRVHWDSERCIHTAICLRSLPEVFDNANHPWVTVDGAPADKVAAAIERCPSGALTYERLDGTAGEQPAGPVEIVPRPNGPLSVRGAIVVRDVAGEVFVETTRATLCRCGQSQNQPFCDLSHRRAGFEDNPRVIPQERGSARSPAELTPTSEDQREEVHGDSQAE